ncbi:hypothetical protein P4S72_29535 [Vibrio sp. PP-XX7]
MSRLSQSQKIVELLKANPNQKFNARQIAEKIVDSYPEDYRDKRQNPRFTDEKAFISQVVAEIGSQKDQIVKNDVHVFWQDKPRLEFIGTTMRKSVGQIEPETDEIEEIVEVSTILKQQLFQSTIILDTHRLLKNRIKFILPED